MRRILLCTFQNGDTKLSPDAIALLIGVSTDHMLERWDPHTGTSTLPTEFKRRATKRCTTARNALGTNAGNVAVAYWAVQTWGCRIDFDQTTGQTWAVIDGGPS